MARSEGVDGFLVSCNRMEDVINGVSNSGLRSMPRVRASIVTVLGIGRCLQNISFCIWVIGRCISVSY